MIEPTSSSSEWSLKSAMLAIGWVLLLGCAIVAFLWATAGVDVTGRSHPLLDLVRTA